MVYTCTNKYVLHAYTWTLLYRLVLFEHIITWLHYIIITIKLVHNDIIHVKSYTQKVMRILREKIFTNHQLHTSYILKCHSQEVILAVQMIERLKLLPAELEPLYITLYQYSLGPPS